MVQKRFLIVDDDERFAVLVAKKLEKYADCTISTSGDEALRMFKRNLSARSAFDAVIMDIEMPDMDGHQTVKQMRESEQANSVAPTDTFKLVMLTAHKDVKNVSHSFFRGSADAYIPKEDFSAAFEDELRKIDLIN